MGALWAMAGGRAEGGAKAFDGAFGNAESGRNLGRIAKRGEFGAEDGNEDNGAQGDCCLGVTGGMGRGRGQPFGPGGHQAGELVERRSVGRFEVVNRVVVVRWFLQR